MMLIKTHLIIFVLFCSIIAKYLVVEHVVAEGLVAEKLPYVTEQRIFLANLKQPSAVSVDNQNNIWVLDGLQQQIVVFDSKAKIIQQIVLKPADNKILAAPMSMLLLDKSILLADTGNHRLVEFNLQGQQLQIIKLEDIIKIGKKPPEPVALWLEDDFLYWSDRANHQLCQMLWKNKKLVRCFGEYGENTNQFRFPFQLATDRDGYLYSVDVLNGRIQIFNSRGKFFSQIGRFGLRAGELFRPNGIAVNKYDFVFVSDSYLGFISLYLSGRFLGYLKDANNIPLRFESPVSLSFKNNKLWVVDSLKNSVIQLDLSYKIEQKNSKGSVETSTKIPVQQHISSRKNCISCHVSWEDDSILAGLQIDLQQILPVASEKMCYSCHHGVIVESRLAIMEQHQHPTIYNKGKDNKELGKQAEKREDNIPDSFPLLEQKEFICSSCHTPHNSDENQEVLYQGHTNSWMRVSNHDGNLCERCHESKAVDARVKEKQGVNHPLAIKFLAGNSNKNLKNYVQETHLQHGLPEELQKNGAVLDKQKQLICQTCHQIHAGKEQALLTLENTNNELCISCHKSKYAEGKEKSHKHGIHPVNIKLDKAITYQGKIIDEVSCSSCHRVHKGKLNTALLWDGTAENIEKLCTICHQEYTAKGLEKSLEKGIHPINVKLEKAIKIKGKKIQIINCLSCHSVHHGQKKTASLVQTDKNGELCKNCHKQQQKVLNSDHDLRLTSKHKKNKHGLLPEQAGLCGSCHSMHKGALDKQKIAFLSSVKIVAADSVQKQRMDKVLLKRDQLCINCHQDKGLAKEKVVDHFSHPYKDLILRSNPKKMPLLKLSETANNITYSNREIIDEFGVIACISCHNPHSWEPIGSKQEPNYNKNMDTKNIEGSSNNSFLHQQDVKGNFCVSCHGIEARIKYKYYHEADFMGEAN